MRKEISLFRNLALLICLWIIQQNAYSQGIASIEKHFQEEAQDQLVPLRKALHDLEEKYKVRFAFENKVVEDKFVNAESLSRVGLDASLVDLLTPVQLEFERVENSFIVIRPIVLQKEFKKMDKKSFSTKEQEKASEGSDSQLERIERRSLSLSAVEQEVSGKITSAETGEGIPGVNVVVKGSTSGTITDANGLYRITVPENATLVFSYVGYATEERAVGNQSVIDLSLVADIKTLGEIVVIGYGTQQRKELTSAISSVSAKEIASTPITGFDQALQGRAAGVQVTQTSGRPGAPLAVRIRGINTMQTNDPLFVIDGVPVFTNLNDIDNNILASINPNDIQSIEVLKDASATAIYGTRASNGVVLITTKRGESGKAKINFDTYYGLQSTTNRLDVYTDSREFMALNSEIRTNSGEKPYPAFDPTSPQFVPANVDHNTDWQDHIFQVAPIQNYNLSFSGGTPNFNYSVSGGYFDQKGIIAGNDFKRYSARVNTDIKPNKRLKFGESLTLSRTEQTGGYFSGGNIYGGSLYDAARALPTIPKYDPTSRGGLGQPLAIHAGEASGTVNPLIYEITEGLSTRYRALGNVYGQYEIIKGLAYKLNVGMDLIMAHGSTFNPSYEMGTNGQPATRNDRRLTEITYVLENTLNYNKTFGKHGISILAGITTQRYNSSLLEDKATGFTRNNINNVGNAGTHAIFGGKTETAYISYLGRINYAFDEKYLLSASLRSDGSSKFAPANRFGVFPGVSIGWRISKERFMENIPFISDVKLRASWGKTGSDFNLGPKGYITSVDQDVNYVLGTGAQAKVRGARANNIGNVNLKWETTEQVDIGLDLALSDNHLTFTADYYIKNTNDLLVNPYISQVSGVSPLRAPFVNGGSVRNKGFEFSLGYNNQIGDFKYSISANFSTVKNEVMSLGNGVKFINGEGRDVEGANETYTRANIGESIGGFFGYKTDGVFDSDEEAQNYVAIVDNKEVMIQPNAKGGDVKFVDVDRDGDIDTDDRTNLGSPYPDLFYGLNINLSYKSVDFALFFQGAQGNEIYNLMRRRLEGMDNYAANMSTTTRDRWTPANSTSDMPRAIYRGGPNLNNRVSDRFIEDGSYLRLKNLQVGYTLPKSIFGAQIDRARVYLGVQNLLTFTKYTGVDPEVQSNRTAGSRGEPVLNNGIDEGGFPSARTFLVGVQIGF